MDMWTSLQNARLDHIPTPPTPFAHARPRLRPVALCLPNSRFSKIQGGRGDFAGNPCLTSTAHNRLRLSVDSPDLSLSAGSPKALPIGGWWVSGKPHPNHTNAVLVLALVLCRPEPWSRNGAPRQALPWCSRVHRFALPFTRSRLSPLGGTLEGIRCSAYAISASAGNRAGRTSLEALPAWLTCKTLCSHIREF